MSDLISTPSQSQTTVSNDAFEALIDLLASDGDDDNTSGETKPSQSLRDPSGRLDFDKIRRMFAAHNGRSVAHPQDGDEETSTSRAPTLPLERPSGHRRSSTFGIQPWVGNAADENPAKEGDGVAPTLAGQPLSFDALDTALAGAQQDVRSLRQQYDQLESVVSTRLGYQVKRAEINDKTEHGDEKGSQAPPGAIMPMTLGPSDVPTEIARLSEAEARRALTALACSLNLSPDAIGTLAGLSPQLGALPLNPARQHDVASIARALKFLGTIDELVWRRTSTSSGPRMLLPVFSEGNIVALVARLELWERAVRRSSRI